MAKTYHVTITCPDRTGLVAAIAGRLFDLGGNLGDITFAVLGTGAEFTALVDLPDHLSGDDVTDELSAPAETAEAKIEVTLHDRPIAHGPMGRVTHVITISGGDQPGFIARIAEVFVEFGANVVHLVATRDPGPEPEGHYTTRFSVALKQENADKCLATVANTAGRMNLDCRWEIVEK